MTLWLEKFAELYHPLLISTLKPYTKIAEISQNQGSLSSSFLPLIPSSVQFHRTDSPLQDFTTLSQSPTLPLTYLVPGSLYQQLYPSNTMDLIYAFQVFNQPSRQIPSREHLIPSFSHSPFTSKYLQSSQNLDLQNLLHLRHNELKKGGFLICDIILKPDPSEQPYSWDCLDLAVQLASEKLPKEAKAGFNLFTSFRTLAQVQEGLEELKEKFKVQVLEEHFVPFPHYQECLKTGNSQEYIKALCEFWKVPIGLMARRVLKNDLEQVEKTVRNIFDNFKVICSDMKPKTVQQLLLVKLEKL